MKNILFISYNKEKVKKIESILEPHYVVSSISDEDKIIEHLSNKGVELLLVDSIGTNADWKQIVNQIKDNPKLKYLPIVFIVNSREVTVPARALSEKNIDMVVSPIIPEVLLARLEVQIELSECRYNFDEVIRNKTRAIEDLEDIIFMGIAELVECRDKTTGGHVKRTAEYVEVLVNDLVKRGLYSDILTPSYVRDMIRSAPLHDLGKIGISDSTLLKNGSLDEEEFEFMKTHSSLGGETIQKMINQTKQGSFLDVAKDMANYHHEKWNGCGYPEGLKGEEIPVCARVMAIADVYDALTTKRPYKEAFTHEDAVKIILNGRDSAFDPIIVDVFESLHMKFKEIKENN